MKLSMPRFDQAAVLVVGDVMKIAQAVRPTSR